MQMGFAFTKLASRLSSIADLSDEDIEFLARMPTIISHFGSHETVMPKGERVSSCCLLLHGYLCWRDTEHGAGQITSVHVPGDVPDLHTLQTQRLPAHLQALCPVVVAFVPHAFFHQAASASLRISHALSLLAFADSACLRNWVVNLGTRASLQRVAHLVCEIALRLRAVGLAKDMRFASPFTQSDLAAACGISPVHANRIIQELRRRGLLQWQSRMIAIMDWHGLAALADFNPDYLWLRHPRDFLPATTDTVRNTQQATARPSAVSLEAH